MKLVDYIDKVKEYVIPKRFGIVAYVCIILHFKAGLLIFGATAELWVREGRKFSCSFAHKTTEAYQRQVVQACLSKYRTAYNSPLPFYQFVSLSFGCTVIMSLVYSLIVRKRVDEIEANLKQTDTEDLDEDEERQWKTVYVFYFYFNHLFVLSTLGILLTILQHAYFYPNAISFKLKYNCVLPSFYTQYIEAGQNVNRSSLFIQCENPTAFERWIWGILVSIINMMFSLVLLGEVVYLCQRWKIFQSRHTVAWSSDDGFVIEYFFRKPYVSSEEGIKFYKQTALIHAKRTGLGNLYIDVVIQAERTPSGFPEQVGKEDVLEVDTKFPPNSVRLENVKDLFYPNQDTKGEIPLSILVIGRPGIGKSSLAEKVIADWASETDEYYRGKIVFLFKFSLFEGKEWENLTLKQFLQLGTRLSKRKFQSICETVVEDPSKAIFIFDGLDEFHGDAISYFEKSSAILNDPDICMSAMDLFIKLVLGDMLKGATVLVTTRPIADNFYSEINFDREVEIVGFTSEKVEKFVATFCDEVDRSELKPIIWNHIRSSSNLCCIPVNCHIVCTALSAHDPDVALPTTLTELYNTALNRCEVKHFRKEYMHTYIKLYFDTVAATQKS